MSRDRIMKGSMAGWCITRGFGDDTRIIDGCWHIVRDQKNVGKAMERYLRKKKLYVHDSWGFSQVSETDVVVDFGSHTYFGLIRAGAALPNHTEPYWPQEKERPRLQIIRGLPGSGKTTLALKRYSHLLRLETDMYFYRENAYRFTMENNRRAVKWFNRTVRECLRQGMDFVVTGVFAAHTERLWGTVRDALKAGYEVYVKTLTTKYKGVHAVPKEHYDSMKAAFVSEAQLKKEWADWDWRGRIHWGLMGQGKRLAHLNRKER